MDAVSTGPAIADAGFTDAPVPLAEVSIADGRLGPIARANKAWANLVDSEPPALVGRRLEDLLHPSDTDVARLPLETLLNPTLPQQARVVRTGWGVVWVSLAVGMVSGSNDRAVVALQDVTAWRRAEQELAHRAAHDSLTGLANRSTLQEHLDRSLARLARRSGTVAVLFCDLDGFKDLNDTFGHRFGDTVLKDVARKIAGAVRRSDVVVRTGGDEFVVVCEAEDEGEAYQVAERIRAALDEPLHIQGRDTTLSVSIGIAHVTGDNAEPDVLVRQADMAMYRAKELGRNRIEVFVPELEERARNRVEAAERMRAAIDAGSVAVEMHPVVSLTDGQVVGNDALARIDGPGGAPIYLREALADAEGRGLLGRLDAITRDSALDWLLAEGADDQSRWVSTSVTARDLTWPGFVARIEGSLEKRGLAPQRLVLEVTESAVLDSTTPMLKAIRRLRDFGCQIAINDVGGGYSSFATLRDLPVDFVKIGRSFIAGLGEDTGDEAIVAAIITVGHSLGRTIIADGVDTAAEADILRYMGCDLGQGRYFAERVPVA